MSDEDLKKAQSRRPVKYDYYVADNIRCNKRKNILYEYIFFPDSRIANSHSSYLNWLKSIKASSLVKYDKMYGKFNSVAKHNSELARKVKLQSNSPIVFLSSDDIELDHQVTPKEIIPTILRYLSNRQSVVYVPKGGKSRMRKLLTTVKTTPAEFVAKNLNSSESHFKKEYKLKIDKTYPMFFSADSVVLFHLLMMSENFSSLNDNFNSSATFLTRIRNYWI
jgi:hypothetical protein